DAPPLAHEEPARQRAGGDAKREGAVEPGPRGERLTVEGDLGGGDRARVAVLDEAFERAFEGGGRRRVPHGPASARRPPCPAIPNPINDRPSSRRGAPPVEAGPRRARRPSSSP